MASLPCRCRRSSSSPAPAVRSGRPPARADQIGVAGAVGLAEGVATDDQRGGLLVVHRHPAERLADVVRRGDRIRLAFGAFRIDVDQAHGGRAVRAPRGRACRSSACWCPASCPLHPRGSPRAPRRPRGRSAKPKVLKPIDSSAHVAGEHDQVGPGDLVAVLLLDRPQQPARLVQARVVRPAVERGEALHALAAAAAAVVDAVGAGGMPAHPDEQAAVVAVVGGPPVLRGGHHRDQVGLERVDVELGELLGVVEVRRRAGWTSATARCSIDTSTWFGHQSWFVRGACAFGRRARIRIARRCFALDRTQHSFPVVG